MQSVVCSSALLGVEAVDVEVQADVSRGLPSFTIVGLGDTAVMEARERVRSAIRATGYEFPDRRVVVNLAPAPVRKHGTGFDLPIALAILLATGQVAADTCANVAAIGELALDGTLRAIPGMLSHAMHALARRSGLLGPADSAAELLWLEGLSYLPIGTLASLRGCVLPAPSTRAAVRPLPQLTDLSEVAGHSGAKRALEVTAAGGHNILLVGPPGSGKTMLARRLPGILPPLSTEERLQTALVHSVAGLDVTLPLSGVRPFRAPHHTCSVAGLVGGGSPARPGEASLAHNGVLFLDELPEFGPAALQTLRQPIEDGHLTLVRADARLRYPSRFTLVAAMNPCPCGYHGDSQRTCTCTASTLSRYASRVGGPLMDRIDIRIRVDRVKPDLLVSGTTDGVTSAEVRCRVAAARRVADERGTPNALLQGPALIESCRLDGGAKAVVTEASSRAHLSGRAITRVLRVARTIADLEGTSTVSEDHVYEALGLREAVPQ